MVGNPFYVTLHLFSRFYLIHGTTVHNIPTFSSLSGCYICFVMWTGICYHAAIGRSSNGRTAAFEAVNHGSNPCLPAEEYNDELGRHGFERDGVGKPTGFPWRNMQTEGFASAGYPAEQ